MRLQQWTIVSVMGLILGTTLGCATSPDADEQTAQLDEEELKEEALAHDPPVYGDMAVAPPEAGKGLPSKKESEPTQQTASPDQAKQQTASKPQQERAMAPPGLDILFEFDSAAIQPSQASKLDELAKFIRKQDPDAVVINGYTDSIGPETYNYQLSMARAESVKRALRQRGIDNAEVEIIPHGENQPVATNDTAEGRQQNRRVGLEYFSEEIVGLME